MNEKHVGLQMWCRIREAPKSGAKNRASRAHNLAKKIDHACGHSHHLLVGAWFGGIQGVAISVAIVMGVGATAWFWLATCRAARWDAIALLKPLGIPTVAIGLSIACSHWLVSATPLPQWSQSVLVLGGYLGIAGVLSGGQVFEVFKDTLLRSLNMSPKPTPSQTNSKQTVV